jgi:D-alanyl-D-alanine carboxypeptidase (penicillin-binding protein 5/6)
VGNVGLAPGEKVIHADHIALFAQQSFAQERAEESERVVNWAFRQFVQKKVIDKDEEVARAKVWMGDHSEIRLVTAEDVSLLLPALERKVLSAEVVYRGPIEAPIAKGQEVAELVVALKDLPDTHIALVSDRDVVKGGFLPRIRSAFSVLYRRVVGEAPGIF